MQFPSHLEIQEEVIVPQQMELTYKPSGEFHLKGSPALNAIDRLIVSSDYHKDQDRRLKSELEQRISDEAKMTNAMTITFLGLATLTLILCAFLSINKSTNQERKQCLTISSQDSQLKKRHN